MTTLAGERGRQAGTPLHPLARSLAQAQRVTSVTVLPPPPPKTCAVLCRAAAARPLRRLEQYTGSIAGPTRDKDTEMALASTIVAESRSQSSTLGVAHDRTTQVAVAGDGLPGPLARGATEDLAFHSGVVGELPLAAYGPLAASRTDGGAVAVAASEAMSFTHPAGTPGTAHTSTLSAFHYPPPKHDGGPPIGASITAGALRPSGSFGITGNGDGPHAIASAGDAVASAFSEHE
jgi:hypothetical protein